MSSFALKNGYIAIVENELGESKNESIDRSYFVASQKPHSRNSYDKSVGFSKIYSNTKYYKSGYSKEINTQLKKMEKNMLST